MHCGGSGKCDVNQLQFKVFCTRIRIGIRICRAANGEIISGCLRKKQNFILVFFFKLQNIHIDKLYKNIPLKKKNVSSSWSDSSPSTLSHRD